MSEIFPALTVSQAVVDLAHEVVARGELLARADAQIIELKTRVTELESRLSDLTQDTET